MILYQLAIKITVDILVLFIKYALISDIGKQFVSFILSVFT